MLGQVIDDRVPRRLRAGEHVKRGPDARVLGDAAHRDEGDRATAGIGRHTGAAALAEVPNSVRRGVVVHDLVGTAGPAEELRVGRAEGGVGRTVELPAHGTVAVGDLDQVAINLECDVSAETGAHEHGSAIRAARSVSGQQTVEVRVASSRKPGSEPASVLRSPAW